MEGSTELADPPLEAAGDRVFLDRIGVPAHEEPVVPEGPPVPLVAFGLSTGVQRRMEDTGAFFLLDNQQFNEAAVALVSTRLPRDEFNAVLASLRMRGEVPFVGLVHPGGEALAVEAMRGGAVGVVAEGNEQAVRALVTGHGQDSSLLDGYVRQLGRALSGRESARSRDAITGLPGRGALDQRLDELGKAGEVPRLALGRVLFLTEARRRLSEEALSLLRRRLTIQMGEIARMFDLEVFAVNETDFAFVGVSFSPHQAERLGGQLARIIETYSPLEVPLALAMGHAGAEVATEPVVLRELTERALATAASEGHSMVVSAEMLSVGVSSGTEFETAQRLLGYVEANHPLPQGHGHRVSVYTAELVLLLGLPAEHRRALQLAAYVHHVGKVGLPPNVLRDPAELGEEQLALYRTYPERGASYLRLSAGDLVADAVASHQEWWDGSGYPAGLAGEDIPLGGRVIAIADTIDALVAGEELDDDTVIERLSALAGTRLDPDLVVFAGEVLARVAESPPDL